EIMPAIMKEFLRSQAGDFHKMKITLPQLAIMNILEREKEANMTDLAKAMNVTTSAMTGVVDRLVRDGYANRSRDLNDRRIVFIKLTTKGMKTVRTAIDDRKRVTIKMFAMISQEEREKYLSILEHIKEHLNG
ncbi:MAG: MarR family transcriptional regulator, partial [Candidatus Omnitrophica bacterium]|nr:MarR family transcriptional regulator [Candidatus Omnitrophota bacterium]